MPLPDFKSSEPYTLGIELELQVVNPPGYDLSQDSSALIAAVKDDIKGGEVNTTSPKACSKSPPACARPSTRQRRSFQ